MTQHHNIERSAFRTGEYVGWDCQGLRYRIRKDGPKRRAGNWWVYPDMSGCIPCFYARSLTLVPKRLETRSAICTS